MNTTDIATKLSNDPIVINHAHTLRDAAALYQAAKESLHRANETWSNLMDAGHDYDTAADMSGLNIADENMSDSASALKAAYIAQMMTMGKDLRGYERALSSKLDQIAKLALNWNPSL
jgi:hypothetical protein